MPRFARSRGGTTVECCLPVQLVTFAAGAACVFGTAKAFANEDRLRLSWTAPPGCPSTAEVRRAALQHADTSAQAAPEKLLEAKASVEETSASADDARWKVVLHVTRGNNSGERVIEAATCQGVAEATAIVLALALVTPKWAVSAEDPEQPSNRSQEEFPPIEEPAPVPSAPEPAPPSAEPSSKGSGFTARPQSGPKPPAIALGVQVATDGATLPFWAVGGALTLAWTPGRGRIELDARRWASQSQTVSDSPAGARLSMSSLGTRACYAVWKRFPFELSPCGGADVHLVLAQGYGAEVNYDRTARWATLAGGALGRGFLTSWLAMRVRLEAFVPLARPTFVVDGVGEVHQSSRWGAAATFGAEALFF